MGFGAGQGHWAKSFLCGDLLTKLCTYKSRLVSSGWSLSALPPKGDIRQRIEHVRFVPIADISRVELKLNLGCYRGRGRAGSVHLLPA
jgi:hypothetical protein